MAAQEHCIFLPNALISFTSPRCTDAEALIKQAASRQPEELGMSDATGKATQPKETGGQGAKALKRIGLGF